MSYQPLVSIVIPVYNGDPYLREAIDSALNQTYQNIEIIVVNDGSLDDGKTEEIAFSYGDKVRYFYKENGGVSTALNYGIRQMKGEWFSWLSHDDIYEPTKIEKQIHAIEKEEIKECVIRCSSSLMDKNGKSIFRPKKEKKGKFSPAKMMQLFNLKNVGLYGCALLIHREILQKCGFFDENMRYLQDADYWTRIMFNGYYFVSIADTLVKIRIHERQMTKIISNRLAPELEAFSGRVVEYYLINQKDNRSLVVSYICKQIREGRKGIAKRLKSEIAPRFSEKFKFLYYEIYGAVYRLIKKIYKGIFVKKHRA